LTAHIVPHPGRRGGPRIQFRTEVHKMHGPVIRLIDALQYGLAFVMETKMEGVNFAYDVPESRLKYLDVQIAVNLQVLTYVINRAFRMKALMVPDTKLPCRQLPLAVPGSWQFAVLSDGFRHAASTSG
jgi:hypothetical protein